MKKYYKRVFLNKGKGVALVEIDDDGEGYGSVKITDCNRNITLSCPTYSDKEKKNSIVKLDRLIEELVKYRRMMGGVDE